MLLYEKLFILFLGFFFITGNGAAQTDTTGKYFTVLYKTGARYSDVGMLVVKAANLAEAETLIRSDVAVKNELFVVTVFEANFFYKGCVEGLDSIL